MDGRTLASDRGVQHVVHPVDTSETGTGHALSNPEPEESQSRGFLGRVDKEVELDTGTPRKATARQKSKARQQDAEQGDHSHFSEERRRDRSRSREHYRASSRPRKRKHGRSRHRNRHDKTSDVPTQPFYYPYTFQGYPPWPPPYPVQQNQNASEFLHPSLGGPGVHRFGVNLPTQIQDRNRQSWGGSQNQEELRPEYLDGLVFKTAIRRPYMTLNSTLAASAQYSWPDHTAVSEIGSTHVQRVLSSKQFKNRDGRYSIELSSDEGPIQAPVDGLYQMHWLHMQRPNMDLSEFEDVCLNSPHLRGELKFVVLQLFKRIRDRFQKTHFEGLQIDPGTVLRCDGDDSRNLREHEHSAIFLCLPYATLVDQKRRSVEGAQDYSMRSLMQILYPYEPSSGRDRAPVFSNGFPNASKKTMFIPQLWVAIIASKYIITCAEADASTLASPTIAVNKHRHLFGLSTKNLNDEKEDSPRPGPSDLETSKAEEAALFRGDLAQENTQRNDDENGRFQQLGNTHNSPGATSQTPIAVADESDKATSSVRPESPHSLKLYNTSSGDTNATNIEGNGVVDSRLFPTETTDNNHEAPLEEMHTGHQYRSVQAIPERDWHTSEATPVKSDRVTTHLHSTIDNVLNHKDRYVAALQSLDVPEMTDQYFLVFLECMKGLLDLRTRFRIPEIAVNVEIILGLEESVRYAELLRGMCQLEAENEDLSENLAYREALIRTLGLQDASFEDVLQGLDQAVQEAIELFTNPLPREEFSETAEGAGYLDLNAVLAPSEPRSETSSDNDGAYATVKGTPPFLSWAWLRAEFKAGISPERLAAENLLIIMEDIGRTLSTRPGFSFENREEMTFNELESTLSKSTLLSRHNTDNSKHFDLVHPKGSDVPSLQVTETGPSQLGVPLSTMQPELNTEDVVFQIQSREIALSIHEMLGMAKGFVRLFIPQTCEHAVAKRIWGALHRISSTATASLQGYGTAGSLSWLVRPLPTHILQSYNIEQPKLSFHSCAECRSGTTYRTVSAAIAHLRRHHFRRSSSLQELAHIHANYRHWIRTEDQVKNEIRNAQHLKLIKICVSYLATLHETAEKLHTGIPQNDKTKLPDYMLPNDLVDCFEATAVFIIEAETSLAAIKDEVASLQYTLGISLDTFTTQIISHALNRLETFGKAALTCMARAEKTLALSDPEADILSMGPSGPESLVSIICQNLQQKQLLEGVDMDIKELYQSHTSKLQYQVTRFPRKRLLRDIQSLQEELSVIQSVVNWQQKTFSNYLRVLDVTSYDAPTAHRVAMFPSESESLKTSLKALALQSTELDALEERTKTLREQLKQSVEILEEDNGKAILVFTMITTIFLPLSFVTSFFGMNTADIRNTDLGQGFFWAIAMPVTFGIVVVAILLAYQGDKLYDATAQAFHRFREKDQFPKEISTLLSIERGLPQHKDSPTSTRVAGLNRRSGLGLRRSEPGSVLLT
ncbi:hypothetical protein BDV96DRAFT_583628 [Lophiotrema nucula]|uniref:DUF7896 domain-containing protein n=1 Tax=Lophiotrema nucula TaxID=690887 RepID=A0A6A5YVB2_9PLEO|nr:hypothetical protein BDV96DRAFT_583628 [Lophiotrema nucula]